MNRNLIGIALFGFLGAGLFGCSKDEGATSAASSSTTGGASGKTLNIEVIPKGSTHEYWKAVHAGADAAGKQFGATITFKGPLQEDDKQSQIDLVDNVVAAGTDAIVLAPLDEQALVKPVQAALDKKIPVVIIDSSINMKGFVSLVATDNYKGGQMAADEMIKLLGGKGKIAMLRYEQGSASTEQREQGFEDEMKSKGSGIQIVSDNQYGGATAASAQKKSEDMLSPLKGPDGKLTIDGLYCPNESTAFGMLRTLQTNGWAGTVKFVGFDSSDKLVDGLKSGAINALVIQNPYKIGFDGVKDAIDAIHGKQVAPRDDTGATLITTATMNTPENHKLLFPPQD